MTKKLSIVGAISGAIMLYMTAVSLHVSPLGGGSLSVSISTAKADLEVPAYRRAYRRYHRVALYDPWCGGPYVGPGWHGGSYWGGPWIDLHCYGWQP